MSESDAGSETVTDEVDFFNPHQGSSGRLPGQYLDEIERKQAEVLRAESEDREPDLEHAPATAGTPLVTEDQLPDNSIGHRELVDPEAGPSVEPAITLPVDHTGLADESPTFGTNEVDEQEIANAEGPVGGDGVTGVTTSNGTLATSTDPDYSNTEEQDNADVVGDSVGNSSGVGNLGTTEGSSLNPGVVPESNAGDVTAPDGAATASPTQESI